MNWYYESGGQQQGPASDSDLDRLLAEGKITLDTLVWREGLPGWTPLRTARPAGAAAPPPPPTPPEGEDDAGWEVTRPAQRIAPAPAGGSDHPEPGWIKCSATGRYFSPSDIIYVDGKPYSAAAKPQVMASLQSGGPLPVGGLVSGHNGPAWEQRATLGLWKALVDTVKAVMGQPVPTFTTMQRTGGLNAPLLFWLLTAGVGIAINQVYGVLFQGAMAGVMSSSGMPAGQTAGVFGVQAAIGAGGIVLFPIFGLIGLFVQAGLIHLTLMMLKGPNQGFEVTFRTLAYAFGATGTLQVIPMCGGIVGGLWGLVVACIGLGPAHGTTTGKGVAAVLIPIGFCCLMVFGLYAVIAGVAVAAASHH